MILADSLKRVESCDSLDVLRGIEGEAARTYSGVFDHLITNKSGAFVFNGRNRRPPL